MSALRETAQTESNPGYEPWMVPSAWNQDGKPNVDNVLRWFNYSLGQGQAYLSSQSNYADIDEGIATIKGDDLYGNNSRKPAPLSRVTVPLQKQFLREELGLLSNIRPMTDFRSDPTDPLAQRTALNLNNAYKAWYLDEHVDGSIDEALQWASLGKGFLEIIWEPADEFDADGEGRIRLKVRGARQVFPIQLPADHDLQRAQAVIITEEMPLDQVKATWREFASEIKPDRSVPTSSSFASTIWQKVRQWSSMFGPGAGSEKEATPFPTCDVYWVYIRDRSLNRTTHEIKMGEGKNWGYTVPPLIDPDGKPHMMWTGRYEIDAAGNVVLDEQQQPKRLMRPVRREECMLYPNRRLIICTKTLLFYDGPSYWWHGKVPLIPFDIDKWTFQWLGFSVLRDGKSINDTINGLLRNIDDSENCRLRPPLMANSEVVPENFMEESQIDTRRAGTVIPMPNATATDKPLVPLLPVEYYNVPAGTYGHLDSMKTQLREIMMLPGVAEAMRAKQIPSGDSLEKLAELSGPGIQRWSRRMEKPLAELGEMFKWLVAQWYTTAKRLQIMGADGVTPEDVDYDPGNMIPDILAERPDLAGPENRYRRARLHLRKYHFRITPNSMHNLLQASRKLLNLQLLKMGFPIDPWTIAESFDMTNFGAPPQGTKTIMDRWAAWQDMQLKLKALLMQEAQELGVGGGGGQQGSGGGRPNTNAKPGQLKTKDNSTRVTNSTSG